MDPAVHFGKKHGGVALMVNDFRLLAVHFRKNGANYGKGMNWGEFIHFMSGAAGENIKAQATTAFRWPSAREAEFSQAQADFRAIKY